MVTNPESDRLNAITEKIIGDAIRVHKELGPGILESACEACLTFELVDLGLAVERCQSRTAADNWITATESTCLSNSPSLSKSNLLNAWSASTATGLVVPSFAHT